MDLVIALIVLLIILAIIGYGGVAIGSNLVWLIAILFIVAFFVWLIRRPRV